MQDWLGIWIFVICVWICAAIFAAIGIWALCRKSPMHFWAGSTVLPSQIRDVPRYNRANGIMWLVAAMVYTLGGLPVLIVTYRKIYARYRNDGDTDPFQQDLESHKPWRVSDAILISGEKIEQRKKAADSAAFFKTAC